MGEDAKLFINQGVRIMVGDKPVCSRKLANWNDGSTGQIKFQAQEFHDILLRNEISRALFNKQFYKSLYDLNEDDVEKATQNFFRRIGITNEDMVRLGFNSIIKSKEL